MDELQLEKEKLKQTLTTISDILKKEQDQLRELEQKFIGSREQLWDLMGKRKVHITNLQTSLEKPYFARIDFTFDSGEKKTVYIGKHGVTQDSNIVVTDWRAPISSLYYDAEIGQCSFVSPDGPIQGKMDLKRQYEIEKGELLQYFDVDLVSNDGLLQQYLNANNDTRLKSIVSTIQQEQNEVIRRRMFDNTIVQGVAGSGKTTVALHRIAYLVYNYMESIHQNQYLVIGPNTVFMKYIQSVLPDLDVSGVEQYTFEQLAQIYVGENMNIGSSSEKVNAYISGKIHHDIDKFKCSMQYKKMLDQFLQVYFYGLTASDLVVDEFTVLNSEQIRSIFQGTDEVYNTNLKTRIDLTIEKLCRYIEEHNDMIISKYMDYSGNLFSQATTDAQREQLRKKVAKGREEIKKNCRNTLKKYFSKVQLSSTKLYQIFVSSLDDFDIYQYPHLRMLKKETLSKIKKGNYDFEDLAALMHIQCATSSQKKFERIRHVVIDEAQDMGEFDFYALREILPSATFSIFGDLAQSIYDYRGIDNWQEVNHIMFHDTGEIVNFQKSYRTTSEIMQVADDVADSVGLKRSQLVVRHGNSVSFTQVDASETPMHIIQKIQEYKENGYKTIAIISKTDILSRYMNDQLRKHGLIIPDVSIEDDLSDEHFRICTISNQLAKGLEFDAVILNDVSEDQYSSMNSLDMKLLYVAITRALHELHIIYSKQLTKPLQKSLHK